MINVVKHFIQRFWVGNSHLPVVQWQQHWSDFLFKTVAFYRMLGDEDRGVFDRRVALFLQTTTIQAHQCAVSDEDSLLVAASAIIPVWGLPKWHYFNLKTICLLPTAFNKHFECKKPDSLITGMAGTGLMAGKLVLSRQALYSGFENCKDKHNTGIHKFVHLADMADGECDGYPARLKEYAFSIVWFELLRKKIRDALRKKNNIRGYAATSRAVFFAIASEYFFERPGMMKKKHPDLFLALTQFYQQDVIAIANDINPRKQSLCSCGSKKRYKQCCMPQD